MTEVLRGLRLTLSWPRPPICAHDPDHLLIVTLEPQFCGGKEPVHNLNVPDHAGVHEFCAAIRPKNKEGRHFALHDTAWEDDIDAAAVVEDAVRSPRWGEPHRAYG